MPVNLSFLRCPWYFPPFYNVCSLLSGLRFVEQMGRRMATSVRWGRERARNRCPSHNKTWTTVKVQASLVEFIKYTTDTQWAPLKSWKDHLFPQPPVLLFYHFYQTCGLGFATLICQSQWSSSIMSMEMSLPNWLFSCLVGGFNPKGSKDGFTHW